jgi:uncharacterized protein
MNGHSGIHIPMRDGVDLVADLYLPDEIPAPAVLLRMPYGRRFAIALADLAAFIDAGYAVVLQDTRGRFASEGEFEPYVQEVGDGEDTVGWVAAQAWSNGEVVMTGASYWGATQWLAAKAAPPALKAIAPIQTGSDYYDGWTYQGGALQLGFLLHWTTIFLTIPDIQRQLGKPGVGPEIIGELISFDAAVEDAYREMPLVTATPFKDVAPYYRRWLEHPKYDEFWSSIAPHESYEKVEVPSFNIGGWYDLFLGGTLANFVGMKQRGAGDAARSPRLLIGPWAHGPMWGQFPEHQFGILASAAAARLTERQIAFFDEHLESRAPTGEPEPPVSIFVMGAEDWRTAADWPLPETDYRKFYLHSSGRAGALLEDGGLDEELPAAEPVDAYLYDPRDPVPTVGGQAFLPGLMVAANAGPRDQREVERRRDVLCFTTAPLTTDTTVIGPIELVLFASSSALDTDFTGKLVDVHPDGRAVGLTEGILRARFRETLEREIPLEPGKAYELSIDLVATANVFKAGHRIRLEVSSSNFPRFDRNTNTGGTIATESEADCVVAVNHVFHDRDRPSHLVLPLITT